MDNSIYILIMGYQLRGQNENAGEQTVTPQKKFKSFSLQYALVGGILRRQSGVKKRVDLFERFFFISYRSYTVT